MKTYKIIFDGYIDNVDLDKMISNEYGKSAALIKSSTNRYGSTEAFIEFDDNIPYEVIELMTDGNVVVTNLILEDSKKESIKEGREIDNMIDQLVNFMTKADTGEILTVIIQSYAETRNLTFDDAVKDLSNKMNMFNQDAFQNYIRS